MLAHDKEGSPTKTRPRAPTLDETSAHKPKSASSRKRKREHEQNGTKGADKADNRATVDEHKTINEAKKVHYEFWGECYMHGMMDGEAIKFQNEKEIRAEMFELR